MTRLPLTSLVLPLSMVVSVGCTSSPTGLTTEQAGPRLSSSRALTFPVTREVTSLYPAMNDAGGTDATLRIFNAGLTVVDDQGSIRPELAAEIPQLNTDTWRVFPDGKMETTYTLRPGLTWHDGQPLEAEDFLFAFRMARTAGLQISPSREQRLMDSVSAVDPRTLVIQWKSVYANANNMGMNAFGPLPRHILEQSLASLDAEAFNNLPFWKSEYVGTGPYRLVRWEPGISFEGAAFENFALGRPKIERAINKIMDDKAIMAEILAGTLDQGQLNDEHYGLLKRAGWDREGKGTLRLTRGNVQPWEIQLRPEYAGHPAITDVRARRALAHTIDREAINDGAFDGEGLMTWTIAPPDAPLNTELDRVIHKYPFDPRRTEQLANEAGLTKDRDGFFVDSTGERFVLDFERNRASDRERIQLIMSDTWQRAGFQVKISALPPADPGREARYTFPGLQGQGSADEGTWASANIGSAANRWTGGNRSGFSNAEYDRLFDGYSSAVSQAERTRLFIAMMQVYTEYLPTFITHFSRNSWATSAALRGPAGETKGVGSLTPTTLRYFNLHEWEWALRN